MKKTQLAIIIIIIAAVAIAGAFIYQKSVGVKPQSTNISELPSQIDEKKLESVFEDEGVGRWGFAATPGAICFATSDMTIKRFELGSGEKETVINPEQKFDAVKLVTAGQSCLVEFFGAEKNVLYLVDTGGKANKINYDAVGPVEAKYKYYVVRTPEENVILSELGEVVQKVADKEGEIFALAPISNENYFAVFNYDSEAKLGSLGLLETGAPLFEIDVENIYSLYANPGAAFYGYQEGTGLFANLVSRKGKLLKKLVNPDPGSVFATKDGFYFVTKPGGTEDLSNNGNGIGYISNSGQVNNIISSTAETEKQYSFGSVQKVGDILYASEGNAIYKVSI